MGLTPHTGDGHQHHQTTTKEGANLEELHKSYHNFTITPFKESENDVNEPFGGKINATGTEERRDED